ncbi:MAG: hypothetical protein AB7Q29_11650 [Vicinamibacterales bacterium]
MSKKKSTQPPIEETIREYAQQRIDAAVSFHEIVGSGELGLDALAEELLDRDREAGANCDRVDHNDDERLREALPEALQEMFRRYVDAVEGMQVYYAEAGYMLGLEVAAALKAGAR